MVLAMPRLCAMAGMALALSACATTVDAPPERVRVGADGTCDADTAQALLGQAATSAVGAELLTMTGARQLRWVPPRTVVTADYRPDRLTVSYDDDMTIERIGCG